MNEPKIRIVAKDRREDEACQAGTPGCCIDHTAERRVWINSTCETW